MKAIIKPLAKAPKLAIYKLTIEEVKPLTNYVSLPNLADNVPALFS